MSKVAVFHHRYKCYGGGERVADALAEVLDADLYTLWVSDECQDKTDATPLMQERYSGLLGKRRRSLKLESVLRPADIERVGLDEYDTVVTSGDLAHCWLPGDGQRHLHYCHTPNRDYFVPKEHRELTAGRGRWLKSLLMQYQRAVDQSHAPHVDRWLCNSHLTADRLARCYGRTADHRTVVNPPIDWDGLGPALPAEERGEYWVTVGRLVPDKRTALLARAFDGGARQLVIAGDGSERERIAELAGGNVRVRGFVAEERKRELLRNAAGFVFAGAREPFGMAVAEALAAGTPVVATDSGNVPHLVGEHGALTDETPETIRQVVREVSVRSWDHQAIRERARQYSWAAFAEQVREIVGVETGEERREVIA